MISRDFHGFSRTSPFLFRFLLFRYESPTIAIMTDECYFQLEKLMRLINVYNNHLLVERQE